MANDEWQTPLYIVELARSALGSIDLDPASSHEAQKTVRAGTYYTAKDNALDKIWPTGSIWLNPPYSRPLCSQFVGKLCDHCATYIYAQAILLVNNSTETKWFQRALGRCSAICFPSKRISFLMDGKKGNGNKQGQALFFFGYSSYDFYCIFRKIGTVILSKNIWQNTLDFYY